jgi:hypothetical protein
MGRSGQTAIRATPAPARAAAPRWHLLYRTPDGAVSWTTTVEAGERSEAEFRGRLSVQEAFTRRGSVLYRSNSPDWWRSLELAQAEQIC